MTSNGAFRDRLKPVLRRGTGFSLSAALFAIAGALLAQTPAPSATEAFYALFRADWASIQPAADAWPDMSLDALIAREAAGRTTLDELHRIDRTALRGEERIRYDIFRRELELRIEQFRVGLHYTPLWSDSRVGSVWVVPRVIGQAHGRLASLPAHLEQLQLLLRRGMESGLLPPRQTAAGIFAADSFPPLEGRSPAEREILEHEVYPALRRFLAFLNEEYLPKCPEDASLAKWPGGRDVYAHLVRRNLGLDVSPEALHRSGLAEVARLRAAIAALIPATGFTGSLDAFLEEVYTNPRFYFEDQRQLMAAYRDAYERVDPLLSKVTGKAPLQPVRFETLRDPLRAAMYSAGGAVRIDISSLSLRPRFEVLSIMLHEGPPGHHLQVGHPWGGATSPEDQRMRQNSAYAEGWGLYAESLGYDLGLYTDPYERFGQLSQELLRAVRLVIDSGMHGLGWSKEYAIEYVVAQTARPRAYAEAEVTRLRNPATQSAYKTGERVFRALRTRAEATLNGEFNLARFHDTVLNWGVLPMEVLEKRFDDCLREACFTAASQ